MVSVLCTAENVSVLIVLHLGWTPDCYNHFDTDSCIFTKPCPVDYPSLVRAKGEVFVLLLLFCSLFCQRFLDNPRANSRQILHAGVVWFRMCLLPFWGLAAPGGRKKEQMKFSLLWVNGCQWGIFAFWRFLSDILHGSTPNIICVGTMSADVPPPPVVPIGPWGAGGGGVKNAKNWEWSHSCIGQLPFLFFSAMPNVVQYVGHRPAHILV